jgi:hypothetical protein
MLFILPFFEIEKKTRGIKIGRLRIDKFALFVTCFAVFEKCLISALFSVKKIWAFGYLFCCF